jgi:GT2 family glycosyltransferase/DNA-binding transcriptional ArsR family regulator
LAPQKGGFGYDAGEAVIRQILQRLVRLSPSAARAAWEVLPEPLRATLRPLVYPIAAGVREGSLRLGVEPPRERAHYDVVLGAGAEISRERRDRLEQAGHRVIDGSSALRGSALVELARRERFVDGVYIFSESSSAEVEHARRLGLRVCAITEVPELLDELFPLVSIVVPTVDNRELCRSCLWSIEQVTGWPRLELLLVDNGSRDGTRAMLAELEGRDRRLRVLENQNNEGFARGTNQGLRAARGRFVVLLNDDTVVAPGWIARLVAHLERDEKLALICPRTNHIGNEARLDVDYRTFEEMQELALRLAFERAGESFDVETVALFCAAARRDVLDALGGLDERYELGMFEDDDLSLTLRQRGFRVGVACDAFVHHVGQATLGKLSDASYLALWEANKRRFEEKWEKVWQPPKV